MVEKNFILLESVPKANEKAVTIYKMKDSDRLKKKTDDQEQRPLWQTDLHGQRQKSGGKQKGNDQLT